MKKKTIIGGISVIVAMTALVLAIKLPTAVHNYRMRHDTNYAVRYLIEGLCDKYGFQLIIED